MPDSVWPHRRQPTRLHCPWESLGKNTGVGCHFLLQCMKVKSESEVAQSCPTLAIPWTAAHQAPPSMGFSRQEYWSGVTLPSLITNLDKCIKKQRHHFANKGQYSQSYSFSSSHVWMWELDHKEGWVPKNWCFWIMVLEKTLEDNKEIKPGNPKGYQPWILFGRTDTEAPILWLRDAKSWLIGKDPDAGKDWRQEEKWVTENEMVGWHHWLNGLQFEQVQEMVKDREAWCAALLWVEKTWIQLSNWTTTTEQWIIVDIFLYINYL